MQGSGYKKYVFSYPEKYCLVHYSTVLARSALNDMLRKYHQPISSLDPGPTVLGLKLAVVTCLPCYQKLPGLLPTLLATASLSVDLKLWSFVGTPMAQFPGIVWEMGDIVEVHIATICHLAKWC